MYEDGGAIVLYMLYVLPAYQRLGAGTLLLTAIERHRRSARSIRVETLRDNKSAIRWYQARGFAQYGSTPHATALTDIASIYMDKTLTRSAKPSGLPTS